MTAKKQNSMSGSWSHFKFPYLDLVVISLIIYVIKVSLLVSIWYAPILRHNILTTKRLWKIFMTFAPFWESYTIIQSIE